MVDGSKVLSLAAVRVWAVPEGVIQGEGLEPGSRSFLCEEDVVDVGEDDGEAFACPVFALIDLLLVCPFGWCLRRLLLRAFLADGDGEAGAVGDDFNLGDAFVVAVGEALGAETSGAGRYDVEDQSLATARTHDIPCDVMGEVVHLTDGTPMLLTLDQIGAEIYQTIDRMALRVGELLVHARQMVKRSEYERWVAEELPFGLDKAKRLRAIYLAFSELPEDTVKKLPRPWQALYALSSVPKEELVEALAAGDVHAEMTVAEARGAARELKGQTQPRVSQADALIGRLVTYESAEMSTEARTLLEDWLRSP